MSFASESRERVRPVLPLAGMVDILFLLLVFFMTASSFRAAEQQIQVGLPASGFGESGNTANQLHITVQHIPATRGDEISLYGRRHSLTSLRATLEQLRQSEAAQTVVIRADRGAAYGLFMDVQDIARQAGFEDIRAAVVEPAAS